MMWKVIFLLIFGCASNCLGQRQHTMYSVVGDTETYIAYLDHGYECSKELTITDLGSSDTAILSPRGDAVRFTPQRDGIWYDTAVFHWNFEPTTHEDCWDDQIEVYITAIGYADSSVKLRRKDIYVPMHQQQAGGQWDGYFWITLDNNIASTTLFENFRLRYNLPPGLRLEINDGTQIITSYTATAFERRKPLIIHLWLPGGPLNDSVFFQGALELDAVSDDTTLKLISYLHVTVYPFVTSSVNHLDAIQSVALHIFPNPFKNTAQFTYSLPSSGVCKLRIINDLGQEIRTIYSGMQSSGTHSGSIDLSDLPSGHYICELKIGDSIIREKIIVIR